MQNDVPTWLKIMQNGTIGEARTKAFLLDRFWILERSVDIDWADFVIQRRITKNNLLDRDPPRLWIVQVKYFESESTTQYIPKVYVVDDENKPRDEFFIICNSGKEDNPRMFFLTSQMILKDFGLSIINGVEKYKLPWKNILGTDKYLINSNKITLDRIENQLMLADFTKNRRFFSWRLPSSEIDINAIHPDYKEPIDILYCNIPEEFKKLKKYACEAMSKVEDIYDLLKKITEEIDPLVALDYLDDISFECRNGYWERKISLPNELWRLDLEEACSEYLKQLEFLRSEWILDKYIIMKNFLRKDIFEFIDSKLPIAHNSIHSVIINLSINDFKIKSINHDILNINEHSKILGLSIDSYKFENIRNISDYSFEYYWKPWNISISDDDKKNLSAFYKSIEFPIYSKCMNKIFDLYYDKKNESNWN